MNQPRILQNQDGFATAEYRNRVTPLVDELKQRPFLRLFVSFRRNNFISGCLMYLCAGKFNAVVTVSHRPAMVYGLLNRLLVRRRAVHVAKEFFFENSDSSRGSIKSIKNRFFSYIYRCALRDVDAVIVNSSREAATYAHKLGLPESCFIFIPWPSNMNHPVMVDQHDGSILAVGRSLRDWNTLFAAVENLPIRCVVIASQRDMAGLRLPSNVELHCDITHDRYVDLLKRAKIVVVPLVETVRSTGQASFLEAMAYGKPVIVTSVVGAWDYIIDRDNGLLYKPADITGLRRNLLELNDDPELQRSVAARALESVRERFNKRRYASDMLHVIDDLCRNHHEAQAKGHNRKMPCMNRRN